MYIKDNELLDLALQSYNEALKICSATNDVKRAFLIKSNIAIVYTLQGKFDSSNYYCFSILKDFPSGSKKIINSFPIFTETSLLIFLI